MRIATPHPARAARTSTASPGRSPPVAPTPRGGAGFDFGSIAIHHRPVVAARSHEERAADRAADAVARTARPVTAAAPAGDHGPLPAALRAQLAPALGDPLAGVHLHTGADADRQARALSARAFTVGRDVYFRRGAYRPDTGPGLHLLAHELAHTVQQRSGPPRVHRAPDPDPLCADLDVDAARAAIPPLVETYRTSGAADDQRALIRALKPIRRCGSAADQEATRTALAPLGTEAEAVWTAAGTALGGYTGMYPGFASDIRKRLTKLGASDTVDYGTFAVSEYGTGTQHRKDAKAQAKAELADLARTDIVYFRGHQFAQYRAPGVFTDGDVERGFDLRYIDQVGGFANVKVMISTSCATLCKDTFDLFHGLFPNAILLGYRKSAPIDGAGVRDAFDAGITALKRPLLLDQPVDIAAIVAVWRSVIESKHAGHTSPLPGYWDGSTLTYWDGSTWNTVAPSDATANKCKQKGDDSGAMPGP